MSGRGRPYPEPEVRFWLKADRTLGHGPDGDCWEWRGVRGNNYGKLRIEGKMVRAHRFSYELHNGFLPEDAYILHRCDNRKCVNPAHLAVGTASDNSVDMISKGRENPRKGSGNGNSKLSDDDVRAIRAFKGSAYAVSVKYGVTEKHAYRVMTRRVWRHLP